MNTASKKTTTKTTTIAKTASTCQGSSSQDEDETAAEDDSEARMNVEVKKERKTCFAFSEEDDIKVLQEVLSDDGIFKMDSKESQQWRGIAIRLVQQGMDVTAHSLRRRVKVIHDAFLLKEKQSKSASDFDEKTQLLVEYDELMEERVRNRIDQKTIKVHINKANDEGGRAIRDAAMATVDRAKMDDKPKFDIHEYLLVQQRQRALELEYQASAKKQRLELEAHQLTLNEQTLILQQQQMQMMSKIIDKMTK
ncbi:hypothetical protein AC1031_004485 [Aphanomyces cochlioides]|nr:hypothetical protein AC1031_004485 [Aphanomyces cochlioides]